MATEPTTTTLVDRIAASLRSSPAFADAVYTQIRFAHDGGRDIAGREADVADAIVRCIGDDNLAEWICELAESVAGPQREPPASSSPLPPEPIANLRWLDQRWHLAGNPIHAGAHLELRGSTGKWFSVRIESRERGRKLDAYATIEGLIFHKPIVGTDLRLRWPQEGKQS